MARKFLGLFSPKGKTKEEFANEVIGAMKGYKEKGETQTGGNSELPENSAGAIKEAERLNAEMKNPNSAISKSFDQYWKATEAKK